MSVGDAVRTVLSQYATFTGRARRSEYWWWGLVQGLVLTALYVIGLVLLLPGSADAQAGGGLDGAGVAGLVVIGLMALLSLALVVPNLAVTVRRLHDTGRSGWWVLITFVPFGNLVLLVFTVLDSTSGPNAYGQNPKGVGGYDGYAAVPGYGATPAYGATPGYGTPPRG